MICELLRDKSSFKKKSSIATSIKPILAIVCMVVVSGSVCFVPVVKASDTGSDSADTQSEIVIVIGEETTETENETNSANDSFAGSGQDNKAKKSGNILSEKVSVLADSRFITIGVDSDSITYSIYREDIKTITFLDSLSEAPEDALDASEAENGSVLAWLEGEENAYDLYIAGNGGVDAGESCEGCFSRLTNVVSIEFNNCFYTGNTYDMTDLFRSCDSLVSLDLSSWDTSNVEYFEYAFAYCGSLETLNLSGWDTSNAKRMDSMFQACGLLETLDVGEWDTSNVTGMWNMFTACRSLVSIDVSNWDTSNVTNMSGLFEGCNALESINVGNWDTSNVLTMGGLFYGCNTLKELDVANWDTSSVDEMYSMFRACTSLTTLDTGSWNTSRVENMQYMFCQCTSLTSLNVSNWDTSNVEDMTNMFAYCSSLKALDVSNWDVSNCRYGNRNNMFNESGIETLPDWYYSE